LTEPMYDDEFLDIISESDRNDFVGQMWYYILVLEEYIIRLRKQVNTLSKGQGINVPFPDSASDFAIRFFDHPAYSEFSDTMQDEELEYIIT